RSLAAKRPAVAQVCRASSRAVVVPGRQGGLNAYKPVPAGDRGARTIARAFLEGQTPGWVTREHQKVLLRDRSGRAGNGNEKGVTLKAPVMPDYNLSYFYVLVFFVVGAAFVVVLMTASRIIAPRRPTIEKLRPYESGEEPVGQAWGRYPIHFYIFALLFVVFDVEVSILF